MFLVVLEQDIPAEDSEVLLELLARREDPALVDAILTSSAFPRLADPTSGTASFLTAALGRLAAGDGPRTHAVARHLMETAGYGDRVQRLRNALALHAALPDSAAENLTEEQHKGLVTWALELREAAGSLSGVTAEPVPIIFIERLIDVHLVKCAVNSERGRWAHPTALLLADLFDALQFDPADGARAPFVGRTMGHFERALGYARSTVDADDNVLVLRDRARFHLMAGDTFNALRDYRKAINLEGGAASVLVLADLRRAASLAADAAPTEPALLPSALDLSLALIGREAWSSEPPGVRLEDLRALVSRAGDSELERDRVRPLFAGLPARDMDLADETLPTKAPWLGLEADAEQLKELRALAESLEAPAPVESVPADPKPSEEAEVSEEGSKPVSEEDPPSRS